MMEAREVKALEMTGDPRIMFSGGVWTVPSQTNPSLRYKVNPSQLNPSCECASWELNRQPCKHIRAVRHLLDRQITGEAPLPVPPRPPRPTYGQQWSEYNAAQSHEKDHFQELLADLCSGIPEPPSKGGLKGGRPPILLRDAVFASVFKVYSTFSARRFSSDLREAANRGHITRELSFNAAWKTLQKPAVTPILHELIRRSSLPLRSVEVDFAVDSTGFGTSKFERWYDEKYGVTRQQVEWVKLHCVVGVKTNVVTAAFIGDKNAADCPQLAELLKATAENFSVREVSGDKAYLSADNLALVDGLGAAPYIPFRINSVLGNTPLWDRMFHYFNMRRDEFLQHYHKRSNVESSFSAVKRLFGDAVRSRTKTAMVNEVLAKLISYNLTCVIHEWYELGIDPSDWGMKARCVERADTSPVTLRFPG
jgi:transposase